MISSNLYGADDALFYRNINLEEEITILQENLNALSSSGPRNG